jgi:hypothetical protein
LGIFSGLKMSNDVIVYCFKIMISIRLKIRNYVVKIGQTIIIFQRICFFNELGGFLFTGVYPRTVKKSMLQFGTNTGI